MKSKEIELWESIPEYEDYEVSSFGRIKSWKNYSSPKLLRPWIDSSGYSNIYLRKEVEVRVNHSVHKLVAQAFVPNPKKHSHVTHIDGDRSNNQPSNLLWIGKLKNKYKVLLKELMDKYKLDEEDVVKIKELL